MNTSKALNKTEIDNFVKRYPEWLFVDDTLKTTFEFKNFAEVADITEKIMKLMSEVNHHPDLSVSYSKITVTTTTHDVGSKVTEKDIRIATEISETLKQ